MWNLITNIAWFVLFASDRFYGRNWNVVLIWAIHPRNYFEFWHGIRAVIYSRRSLCRVFRLSPCVVKFTGPSPGSQCRTGSGEEAASSRRNRRREFWIRRKEACFKIDVGVPLGPNALFCKNIREAFCLNLISNYFSFMKFLKRGCASNSAVVLSVIYKLFILLFALKVYIDTAKWDRYIY